MSDPCSADITPLNEEAIRKACKQFQEAGIRDVAIVGVFSPSNPKQEIRASEILKESVHLDPDYGSMHLV